MIYYTLASFPILKGLSCLSIEKEHTDATILTMFTRMVRN